MSSLSRAFTTRRVKQSIDLSDAARGKERSNNFMQRSKTTKGPPRAKISAPMELVHTTNMLSYNAPDIRPRTTSSSNSSTKSSEEDSESTNTAASSPPTSPDVAPHERSTDPEPNHLSCYFVAPNHAVNPATIPEVPKIPKRAPSHTKQASFDAMARQRSMSSLSKTSEKTVSSKASMTFSSRASSGSSAASTMSHNSIASAPKTPKTPVPPMPSPAFHQHHQQPQPRHEKAVEAHPFGRELAQVTEIAEEFGIKDRVMDEEERTLKAQGLRKFAAEDYLAEVQSIFTSFFPEKPASSHGHAPQRPMAAAWI
ncbi:hypothetical protein CkaCkLH20_05852 [Colletotrichum karsti]|uniref:Uncharacterized protein n=1 Tax=Colletotrichum karsti TaxID=1095194 RepID=A0A9P6I5L2_9PEZI|nr:uncharacterized protein CkaCkLH20_05852 [Colletotrichum karsti]KAF9876444.1 hypothetical protein CkaCkLH20_05852 [Colletotrichum karsti]